MTGDTAQRLLAQYAVHLCSRGPVVLSKLKYLVDFAKRAQDLDPVEDERKLMRWLGFMQGALWMDGWFDVNTLKEHSRKGNTGD